LFRVEFLDAIRDGGTVSNGESPSSLRTTALE
jgi:hypothetical protein